MRSGQPAFHADEWPPFVIPPSESWETQRERDAYDKLRQIPPCPLEQQELHLRRLTGLDISIDALKNAQRATAQPIASAQDEEEAFPDEDLAGQLHLRWDPVSPLPNNLPDSTCSISLRNSSALICGKAACLSITITLKITRRPSFCPRYNHGLTTLQQLHSYRSDRTFGRRHAKQFWFHRSGQVQVGLLRRHALPIFQQTDRSRQPPCGYHNHSRAVSLHVVCSTMLMQ